MVKAFAAIIILVLCFVHPHKVFDPEECIGICLFDGTIPAEQTITPDGLVQL